MELEGKKKLQLPEDEGQGFFKRLNGLLYRYEFPLEHQTYSVSMELGDEILLIKRTLFIMLLAELIMLLGSILPGARLIRSTLHPITILTEAAQSLNRKTPAFESKKVENLTDTLDSINAARLDTGISIDETEEELQSLTEAINGLLDRINDSYRSQIRFVSDASHELRTPISVIEGYASLLTAGAKKDEKTLDEGIKAIKDEASHSEGPGGKASIPCPRR